MPAPSRGSTRSAVLALVAALVAPLVPVSWPLGAGPSPFVAAVRAQVTSPYVPAGAAPVAPGVTQEWGSMTTSSGNQDVHVVTVDPTRPEISLDAALSNDTAASLERTTATAIRRSFEGHRVVAAVNGDVWASYTNLMTTAPNGIHVEGGELMVADAAGTRVMFGVGADRVARVGLVRETITMTVDGVPFPVGHVNQSPNGSIGIFTPRFGPRLSTALTGTEVVVAGLALPLTPTGAWSGVVTAVRSAGGGAPIDPGTAVLVLPASSLALLGLTPGSSITLAASITPGWETVTQAVTGRGFLVRDGAIDVSPRPANADGTHPRSAVGVTADGRVIMLTVDGRRPDASLGVDLDDLANLMLGRGAVNAINLDGGSSSTLAVRQPGATNVSVVNTPSAGYEIPVTNGLEVVLNVPTGPLGLLTASPATVSLYPGQGAQFGVVAQDAAYNPVVLAPGELVWSVDPALGTVDAGGRFTASTVGTGLVTVQAQGVAGTAAVVVLADTTPPVASPPRVALPAGAAIGPTVPVVVAWASATDVGAGVASVELQLATDGGAWKPVAMPAPMAGTVSLSLARNRRFQFRVRATDLAGNAGAWAEGARFRLAVAPETTRALTFVSGTWLRASSTSYDGGYARTTRTAGALARFTFTGTGFAWVAAKSPVRGTARVSVDGGPAVSVSLYQATSVARRMVLVRSWPAMGTHTVTITVAGTPGHPRVDIDAFVVLAPG